MNKIRRIDSFFEKKRKNIDSSQPSEPTPSNVEVMVEQPLCASVYKEPTLISEQPLTRIDIAHLIRDPSNRPQIWEYPVNQQDEIRRAYINLGPYQPLMSEYPLTSNKHPRRFQSHWFKSYGLNIQRKILHFVSLAIYFQVNHLESQDQTHLLLKDLIVGRKLMMGNDVLF